MEALVAAAAAEPSLTELCLIHGCGRTDPTIGPYDPGLVEALTTLFEEGAVAPSSRAAPAAAELLAHGILSVLARRLRQGDAGHLRQLDVQLTEITVQVLGPMPAGGA